MTLGTFQFQVGMSDSEWKLELEQWKPMQEAQFGYLHFQDNRDSKGESITISKAIAATQKLKLKNNQMKPRGSLTSAMTRSRPMTAGV